MANVELIKIIEKFSQSGWDLIDVPSKKWLADNESFNATAELIEAVKLADKECGSCGCELDPLYTRALELLIV